MLALVLIQCTLALPVEERLLSPRDSADDYDLLGRDPEPFNFDSETIKNLKDRLHRYTKPKDPGNGNPTYD